MDEDGILWLRPIEGAVIDLAAFIEDDKTTPELTGGKKALALYDGRANFTETPDAKAFIKSRILERSRIATAVLTDKLFMRLLVNFVNNFAKPKSPVKMFSNEKKAKEWLLSFKN
jgi:hypothetical protein